MLLNCPTVMTKDIALMVGYVDEVIFLKYLKKIQDYLHRNIE